MQYIHGYVYFGMWHFDALDNTKINDLEGTLSFGLNLLIFSLKWKSSYRRTSASPGGVKEAPPPSLSLLVSLPSAGNSVRLRERQSVVHPITAHPLPARPFKVEDVKARVMGGSSRRECSA